jgi:hypothetical protein
MRACGGNLEFEPHPAFVGWRFVFDETISFRLDKVGTMKISAVNRK